MYAFFLDFNFDTLAAFPLLFLFANSLIIEKQNTKNILMIFIFFFVGKIIKKKSFRPGPVDYQ